MQQTVVLKSPPGAWSYEILRRKWNTVPAAANVRAESGSLLNLPDRELLAAWDHGYLTVATGQEWGRRGWYHDIYRDKLADRRVLDLGCGFGLSTIHFAEHGARVTFADIVEENVELVRRVCGIKGISAEFLYIESNSSFAALPDYFDFVLAIGSLINAPLDFTRAEIQSVLPHLKRPGRWLHFGYPKARWLRDGSLPFDKWGAVTDGEGTPWMVYHEREAMTYLFEPTKFEVLFECEWHNKDFNWFDLRIL